MSGRFFALFVVAVAVAAFFLGLADRPPFVATTAPDLVVIVSLSDDKDIGGSLMRLLEGTIKGIRATTVLSKRNINGGGSGDSNNSHNKRALMSAASRYGSPLGSEYLSVGLFLDDPRSVSNPRWAIGYAVDVPYEVAKEMASEMMNTVDGSNNVVRAVRISLSSTLSARVPWRSIVTPMIAPRLHWPRGMDLYKTEGRATTCGRHSRGDDINGGCAIAMEAYVTGPKGSREWIDYTIVMGDTTVTFDDLYPEVGTDQQQHSNNQQAQQQVPPDVQEVEPQLQEVEPQQVEPESVVDEAVAESQSQQPDSDASKVGDPAADDVPPAVEPEPEQEARHASETETHESDPQDAPNDKVEELHAPPEEADAGGVDDGTASTTQHDGESNEGEEEGGDGNPVVDAEAGEEEGFEHEGEEDGDEHGDEAGEEEEEAHEDEESEEQEHDEENDGEEAGAEEEEEEESFEEDEGEELNDEGDVVEHFEDDEERHDEF